jgi:hypothetical protein
MTHQQTFHPNLTFANKIALSSSTLARVTKSLIILKKYHNTGYFALYAKAYITLKKVL